MPTVKLRSMTNTPTPSLLVIRAVIVLLLPALQSCANKAANATPLQSLSLPQTSWPHRLSADHPGHGMSPLDIKPIGPPDTVHPDTLYVDESSTDCRIVPSNQTMSYFKSRMILAEPNFIHIRLVLWKKSNYHAFHAYNYTSDTFLPNRWVWTYMTPNGIFPYLNWNPDYGLLSFGLLDAKTLRTEPFIVLIVPDNCTITYGSPKTTKAIANALLILTESLENVATTKYDQSFYCYLAEAPGIRDTLQYQAALYFLLPINYINYNCCSTYYNYSAMSYTVDCLPTQMSKWIQCTVGPYVLGIILYLYVPILLLRLAAWTSKTLNVTSSDKDKYSVDSADAFENDSDPITVRSRDTNPDTSGDNDWVYLDGSLPRTILDTIDFAWCGLSRKHPILISRIRRLMFVLLVPLIVYIQLIVYHIAFHGIVTVPKLIAHGAPMGFLALLGEHHEDVVRSFVPILGGPKCLIMFYHILGILFLVIPNNLSQIMENGMPKSTSKPTSPLCLGAKDVHELSMSTMRGKPGYTNCQLLCKCGIYMLFSKLYWSKVFEIQKRRLCIDRLSFSCVHLLKCMILPIYAIFCLLEISLSIVYYGIPLCTIISVLVRGSMRWILSFKILDSRGNRSCFATFTNVLFVVIGSVLLGILFVFYLYVVYLVFVQSVSFLAQIVVFCFVAVIVYPSESFGYLFFFVILIYYIVRLIHGFGEVYLELLYKTVDIARNLDGHPNYVTVYDGHIVVSNVNQVHLKSLRINDIHIDIPDVPLQFMNHERGTVQRVRLRNHAYGIPKALFEEIILKHRPVHEEILRIAFQIGLITFLIVVTLSITTRFVTCTTSEISEMMHVIFIVSVGALPRVLEIAMSDASEPVKKEIELRRMEQTIVEFWQTNSRMQDEQTERLNIL